MKTKKYSVEPKFSYDDNDILDIISAAIYDISYWGGIDNDANEWWQARSKMPKDCTFEDLMYYILKKGEKVIIYDVEDDYIEGDGDSWDLTMDKLLNGIKLTIENKYWDGDLDTIDGEVGDIIFQYALFDEIVFG